MPQLQLQLPSTLLSEAVRHLHELSDLTAATGCARRSSPVDPRLREAGRAPGPWAYTLGRRAGTWAVDDVVPVSGLLGWRAPPSSWAVVVVASGQARYADTDPATSGTTPGHRSSQDQDPSVPAPRAPMGSGPMVSGPMVSGPMGSGPMGSGPMGSGPMGSDPMGSDPMGSDPMRSGSTGSGPMAADGVGLALGVARSGETVARLAAGGRGVDHTPESGRLLDTLRRNLGLPTAPPPEDTTRFLAVAWLASIAVAPIDGQMATPVPAGSTGPGQAMGWPAAVRLHPASRLLLARGERLGTADLEGIMAVARSTWTWEVLHRAEMHNPTMAPLCPPRTAPWMDTGMYARWVLAGVPTTDHLWRRARTVLTPVARRRVKRWLQQCDVAVDLSPEAESHLNAR